MIKKLADTDVPIMPPILLNEPNLWLIAEAVAATTTDVITTMLATWYRLERSQVERT